MFIFSPFRCTGPEGIEIGNNVNIANNCLLGGEGGLKIGNFVMIGPNSCLVSVNHGFDEENIPMLRQSIKPAAIEIEDDVWLGANVVILPGVKIGQGAIVGAGSVVSRNVLPYTIVAGSPAKIIRKRFSDKQIETLLGKNSPLFNYYKNDFLKTNQPKLYLSSKKHDEEYSPA